MTASLEPRCSSIRSGPTACSCSACAAPTCASEASAAKVGVRARDGGSLEDLTVERGDRYRRPDRWRHRLRGPGAAGQRLPRRPGRRDPAGATLVIEGASSDIIIEDLTGDQRIRTASGDVTLRGGRGTITIEAVSGDVDVTAVGPSAMRSGPCPVTSPWAGSLSSLRATTSGDLRIAGRFDGPGPFTLETLSGDARRAGRWRPDRGPDDGGDVHEAPMRTEGSPGDRTMIVGPGGATITFRSASGDLRGRRGGPAEGDRRRTSRRRPLEPHRPQPLRPSTTDAPAPALVAAYEDARLGVLRALERGDIVDAYRR